MNNTMWRVCSIIEIALAVLAIVAIAVFGDCPTQIQTATGGTVPMKCHWTFLACDLMAGIAAVGGVVLAASKGAEARRNVALCCLAAFVAIILAVTVVMGVCTGEMSECKTTGMVVVALAAAGGVLAVIQALKPVQRDLPKQKL